MLNIVRNEPDVFKRRHSAIIVKCLLRILFTFCPGSCYLIREVSEVFVSGKATKTFSFVAFLILDEYIPGL
jgi:hypothetical protein